MTDLSKAPRGIRNNNPGNIRADGTKWKGLVGDDGSFCKFDKPENGIRAIARILATYKARGIKTVRQIIARWAPPNENDTEAYIRSVAAASGIPENGVPMQDQLPDLIAAIIKHENGEQPYTRAQIISGVMASL